MMKKYINILLASIFLSGCTTLETYIENVGNEYTAVPLIRKHPLIFGETFTIENYSLDYKGNESSASGFFVTKKTTIRKYNFLKDKTILCRIEIVKRENKIGSDSGGAIIFDEERYIRIIENDRSKKEYAINMDEKSYLTYHDDIVGSINIINYYQLKNKDALERAWLYNTGFNISINDMEYGILAFYPLLFYRRNADNKTGDNTYDKIILCVLAAYASYLYD
ncbi:MAG: hypothetical protein LBG43_04535 [Treponema sp.]|jgi:hypothetical protein|nr:hypothetical protein [Treponema sp.]